MPLRPLGRGGYLYEEFFLDSSEVGRRHVTTELNSFAEAADLAMKETGLAEPVEVEASLPEAEADFVLEDGQAEAEPVEQTDSQDVEEVVEEDNSLFADIEIEEASLETAAPEVTDDTSFELPGVESPVTLKDLKDGYLRQSDYTRKTQEVAEMRKQNEKAIGLWEALKNQPDAVVRQLAVQAGLIEEGATPVKVIEHSPITSPEEVEAEVQARVEQALAEHPMIQQAEEARALQIVNQEFDRIAAENNVTLTMKDREVILREASRRNVADLELVFTSLMSQRERKAQERNALKDAAPARPTGATSSEANTQPVSSFQEAAQRAMIELGMKS